MSGVVADVSENGILEGNNNSSNNNETKINDDNDTQKNDNNCLVFPDKEMEISNSFTINSENNIKNNNNINNNTPNSRNNEQILPQNISTYHSFLKPSKPNSLLSSIHPNPNISGYSDFGSSFFSLENFDNVDNNEFFYDRFKEGYIPFFVKLNGEKTKFILAKKETMFLDIVRELEKELIITDNLGKFYQNNKLINNYKTVGDLNIQIFDRNITNFISSGED